MSNVKRHNYETREDGTYVCYGNHDRSERCDWIKIDADEARLQQIQQKLDHVPMTDPETSIYYVYYKEDVAWLLEKLKESKDRK